MDIIYSANRYTYIGLFFTTLSILMYEIFLTRIFSVVAYYHFAFIAISIAMFGMTLGGMLVYLLPSYQRTKNLDLQLTTSSLLFSVTLVLSFIILLTIPLQFHFTLTSLLLTMSVYVLVGIPFIFAGIVVALTLTKYVRQLNALYATDLLGAGLGCIIVILSLNTFSATTTLFIIAVLAGIGGIFFSQNITDKHIQRTNMMCTIFLCMLVVFNIIIEKSNYPIFRFSWIKNHHELAPLYEKWNSFSRLAITGNPLQLKPPFGWGFGPHNPVLEQRSSRYLWLTIDASAGTPLINYNNNLDEVDYLKYDVVYAAHYLRPISDVLIIGVGGGRDILSALSFKQRSIVGLEINPDILDLLTKRYADYTGRLNLHPHVSLINDEARSYLARMHNKFDIIQMSLIDTWAATSAGAFALSENSLYTVQSWISFLNHLTPNGILSISRWYLPIQPAEMYRLTVLAREALLKSGVTDPKNHIIIISTQSSVDQINSLHAATMLVNKNAFSKNDIILIENLAKKMHFTILLSPFSNQDSMFAKLVSSKDISPILNKSYLDLSAPTDDKPYFFQLIKMKSIFENKFWQQDKYLDIHSYGVIAVGILLMTVILLTFICILTPFMLVNTKNKTKMNISFLILYALGIGIGFMLVEISQIQKLTIFLGNPTYGLSVVLFTLLISCGIGSLMINKKLLEQRFPIVLFLSILIILSIYGLCSSDITSYFQTYSTPMRITIAVFMIFPIGFFMGKALPIGLNLTNMQNKYITPWVWAVNGAASICGSVLAIALALSIGIAHSFWIGVACYVIAFLVYFMQIKNMFRPYNRQLN